MKNTLKELLIAGVAAGAILSAAVTVQAAEETGTNVAEKAGDEAKDAATNPVETLALARDLYAIGERDEDPILVIAAARLAAQVPTKPTENEPEQAALTEGEPVDGPGTDTPPATLETMLETARELADGDETLVAMIDEIDATGTRGPVRGVLTDVETAAGRSYVQYTEVFRAGELAAAEIDGGGDGDLDLYVYDQNGNEICRSTRYGDREICVWRPRWQGPFRVRVVNLNTYNNRYRLAMY